eukprot:7372433-Pyramimonas_sp.AAC.1
MLRAQQWMLRAQQWMLRAPQWMLRAQQWMLRAQRAVVCGAFFSAPAKDSGGAPNSPVGEGPTKGLTAAQSPYLAEGGEAGAGVAVLLQVAVDSAGEVDHLVRRLRHPLVRDVAHVVHHVDHLGVGEGGVAHTAEGRAREESSGQSKPPLASQAAISKPPLASRHYHSQNL